MVRVRDLPVAGRVTWLLWRKRRFYCDGCGRTFTETHPALPSRQRVTDRFRQHLFERCRGGAAHLEIARDERTSCYQVNRAFAVGGDEPLARRESALARRLSLDEAHHRRSHELATVVSDLDRLRVAEVLDGRSRQVVERYLRALPEPERRAIRVVSIDPYEAYRQAVQNELPWARRRLCALFDRDPLLAEAWGLTEKLACGRRAAVGGDQAAGAGRGAFAA